MPVIEYFLDKRGEALGNTFLGSHPEEEVVDLSILRTIRKRSRSWAHPKSRSDDELAQLQFTSYVASEHSLARQQTGQSIANDPQHTRVGASTIPNNESAIATLLESLGPSMQSYTTSPTMVLGPEVNRGQGQLSACQQGLTLLFENQAREEKKAAAAEETTQEFLEFVDQLKSASPKNPQLLQGMATHCAPQSGPSQVGILDAWLVQLQRRMGQRPDGSVVKLQGLPAGSVSSDLPTRPWTQAQASANAKEEAHMSCQQSSNLQSVANYALNKDTQAMSTDVQEASDDQESYLSKHKALGIIEEWHLAGHPEIPEGCTVMIRNIPGCMMVRPILDHIELLGLGMHVQCFYMPSTFSDKRPISNGYAFVNFDCNEAAEVLEQAWHNAFSFLPRQCLRQGKKFTKALNISRAKVQGLRENLLRWSNSKTARIKNDYFKPMLFNEAMRFGV
mmetsp:Transcript_14289/g.25457  ORF Transcript_14289/g.25457 Transcript_14289/m.25457 type:complete len:449 (+) Transcript_14289:19-1365(+)